MMQRNCELLVVVLQRPFLTCEDGLLEKHVEGSVSCKSDISIVEKRHFS